MYLVLYKGRWSLCSMKTRTVVISSYVIVSLVTKISWVVPKKLHNKAEIIYFRYIIFYYIFFCCICYALCFNSNYSKTMYLDFADLRNKAESEKLATESKRINCQVFISFPYKQFYTTHIVIKIYIHLLYIFV